VKTLCGCAINDGFGGTTLSHMQVGNFAVSPFYGILILSLNSKALPLSDDCKETKIKDDDLVMHLVVETPKVPNPTDDSDFDFFKVMIDETIVHFSNFLCPLLISHLVSSHMSLGFGSLSLATTIQNLGILELCPPNWLIVLLDYH